MLQEQQRFLSFDPGQTNWRICYTRPYFEHSSGFARPKPLTFDGGKSDGLPPFLESDGYTGFDGKGDLLHRLPSSALIHAGLAPLEDRPWAVLLKTLAAQAVKLPAFSGIQLSDVILTAASPADPALEPQVSAALEAAGFCTPQFFHPAKAAVLDLLYSGELPWTNAAQVWLVIDAGCTESRVYRVEHSAESPLALSVLSSTRLPWGGLLYDQALLDGLLIPAWQAPQPPTADEKNQMLLLAAALKEEYSRQMPSPAVLHHHFEGLRSPLELNQDQFEDLCETLNQQWWEELNSPELALPEFDQIDGVILVGSSANWKFVFQGVKNRWPKAPSIRSGNPGLSIARGLALAQTNFIPSQPLPIAQEENIVVPAVESGGVHFQQPDSSSAVLRPPDLAARTGIEPQLRPRAAGPRIFTNSELQAIHHEARKRIWKYALIGATVALLLSWLPFASWPLLLALEVHMFLKISNLYNQRLGSNTLWFLLGGLLLISFLLSWVIAEAISILSAYVAAPIVKPLIAGLVIWGLGEGAISILDRPHRPSR